MKRWLPWSAYLLVAASLVAVSFDLPYHVSSPLALMTFDSAGNRGLTIVGDSITAGMGESAVETWPSILSSQHRLQIQDFSHVAETVSSAYSRIENQTIEGSVVVVEIGGNDVLSGTPTKAFERGLNDLLKKLAAPERQIMMFELPLPPFCHEYGRIQRKLAAKYRVNLIPKRVFLSIIAGSDATIDSVHLSASGHRVMANHIWSTIGPAFSSTPDGDLRPKPEDAKPKE